MRYKARAVKALLVAVAALAIVTGTASSKREPAPSVRQQQPPHQRQARAGMLCMPRPSACGFPDVTNTGVTPGTSLSSASGVVTLSTPGQVYQNKQVTGSIIVTAP